MEEKQKFNYLKKYKFNLEKYEELLELKNYFQMKLDLYSKSPFVIMDRLETSIKLLDTRWNEKRIKIYIFRLNI